MSNLGLPMPRSVFAKSHRECCRAIAHRLDSDIERRYSRRLHCSERVSASLQVQKPTTRAPPSSPTLHISHSHLETVPSMNILYQGSLPWGYRSPADMMEQNSPAALQTKATQRRRHFAHARSRHANSAPILLLRTHNLDFDNTAA